MRPESFSYRPRALLATARNDRIEKIELRIALAVGTDAGERGDEGLAIERLPGWLNDRRSRTGRSNRQVLVHDRDPIAGGRLKYLSHPSRGKKQPQARRVVS